LIAGTVKIPLIESDVFRPGDKACRNAAQTADFTSRAQLEKWRLSWLTLDAGFEGRRITAASSRSISSKQLSSDRRSGVLLKIEISRATSLRQRCARSNASVVRIKNTLPVQKTSKLD
jgi:hypothetical protein